MKPVQRIIRHMLFKTFEEGIVEGALELVTPDGTTHHFKGSKPGAQGVWHIYDWKVVEALASRGDIGLGETYTDGLWDSPDLDTLFQLFIDNLDGLDRYAHGNLFSRLWFVLTNRVLRRNSVSGSSGNIRSHYDVGNEFYKLWLDPSMTYSSALYDGTHSLEEAQLNKYQRILNNIESSRKNILEVGCGWGGFAEQAARQGHNLTGITISPEQHAFASSRMQNRAAIKLQDYRHTGGTFDAIVSIEMFEAVGMQYWGTYFQTLKKRMDRDGVAMVQAITVKDHAFDSYVTQSDYIRHYVFPGGMLPSLKRLREAAGEAGLSCKDVFCFGQDYARTLRDWLIRFNHAEPEIRQLGHDTRFIRSWRLYLSMCAASFARERTNVMQVKLVHA
jgi:cyclopropane-fatty-acyl-phospholipid synthase